MESRWRLGWAQLKLKFFFLRKQMKFSLAHSIIFACQINLFRSRYIQHTTATSSCGFQICTEKIIVRRKWTIIIYKQKQSSCHFRLKSISFLHLRNTLVCKQWEGGCSKKLSLNAVWEKHEHDSNELIKFQFFSLSRTEAQL